MKFSIATLTLCLLSTLVKADSYSEAVKEFCGGIKVTAPTKSDVFVTGQNSTVTVTREPNEHNKNITALDLYSVDSDGNPKYISNVWMGKYPLVSEASIYDEIPTTIGAGLYYYRVWITNVLEGNIHGPDCLRTSRTFKVTTGSHTNDAGEITYAQSLTDTTLFKPEFAKGCFGLTVKNPVQDATYKQGEYVSVVLERDGASQTDALTRVEIYKYINGDNNDELVDTVWSGEEALVNAFTVKDQLSIPSEKFDPAANYYYKIDVTSQVEGETCSFQSATFKATI